MCEFRVGDEVVCVGAAPCPEWARWEVLTHGKLTPPPLVCGRQYTIRAVVLAGEGVHLHEVLSVAETYGHLDRGFRPDRFRKVERRNDSISIEAFLTIKPGFEEPRRPKAPAKKRERA